jgi:hypothetical protein
MSLIPVVGCKPGAESRSVPTPASSTSGPSRPSPLSTSYRLSGRDVTLHDGKHDEPAAPGSAARNSTSVWGSPLEADLDGDGDLDAVVVLVNEPGGSGTFYYIAAATRQAEDYRGSEALLLGDRIAPQAVAFESGLVTVTFAERRAGDVPDNAPATTPR